MPQSGINRKSMRKHPFLWVIVGLSAVFFVGIWPLREFPSGDGWMYSMAVKDTLQAHHIVIPHICPGTMIVQLLWGALFCLCAGGFSFGILNVSTFILGVIGVAVFYFLLKELGFGEKLCRLGALCLMLNPLYVFFSSVFMLEVPCLSLMLLSLLLYIKGLEENKTRLIILGSFFSAAAFLVKQYGIIPALSAAAYLLFANPKARGRCKKAFSICTLPFLALIVHSVWYARVFLPGSLVEFYYPFFSVFLKCPDRLTYLTAVPRYFFFILLYLGLFVSPLLLAGIKGTKAIIKNKKILIVASIFVAATGIAVFNLFKAGMDNAQNAIPYGRLILHQWGIGPVSIVGSKRVFFSLYFQRALTVVAIFFGAIFATLVVMRIKKFSVNGGRVILLISGTLSLALTLVLQHAADYHFIYLLPISIVAALQLLEGKRLVVALTILGLILSGVFSLLATREYMDWNEVRWKAAAQLLQAGVPPRKIEGGYEWGYYLFSEEALQRRRAQLLKDQSDECFFVKWIACIEPPYDPEYILSFSPVLKKGAYLNRMSSIMDTSGLKSEYDYKDYRVFWHYNLLTLQHEPLYVLKRADKGTNR